MLCHFPCSGRLSPSQAEIPRPPCHSVIVDLDNGIHVSLCSRMSDTSNQIDPRSHKYIEIEISDGKGVGSIAGDYIDRITPDLYQIVRSIAQILELIY